MDQYIYPVIFFKDEESDDNIVALFPDLNITTDGDNYEEAYLFAKDYLRVYIETALKNDLEIENPTDYLENCDKFKKSKVVLIDVIIDKKRIIG